MGDVVLYREWPEDRAAIEAVLRSVGPGDYGQMDTAQWHRAFTRISGPYDALFGPSETPMQVFRREWPDLEFVQIEFNVVEVRHWLDYQIQRETRVSGDLFGGVEYSHDRDNSLQDSYTTEVVEVTHLYDRRTGKRVRDVR